MSKGIFYITTGKRLSSSYIWSVSSYYRFGNFSINLIANNIHINIIFITPNKNNDNNKTATETNQKYAAIKHFKL